MGARERWAIVGGVIGAVALIIPRPAFGQTADVNLSVDPGSTTTVQIGGPCSPGPRTSWNASGGLGGWVKHGNIVMVGGQMVFSSNDRPANGRAVSPDVQLDALPIRITVDANLAGTSPGVAFRLDLVDSRGTRTVINSGDVAGPATLSGDVAGGGSTAHLEIIDLTRPTTGRDLLINAVSISVPSCPALTVSVPPGLGTATVRNGTTVDYVAPDYSPAATTSFVVTRCLASLSCSDTRVSVAISASPPTTPPTTPPPTSPPPTSPPPTTPSTTVDPSSTSVDPPDTTSPPTGTTIVDTTAPAGTTTVVDTTDAQPEATFVSPEPETTVESPSTTKGAREDRPSPVPTTRPPGPPAIPPSTSPIPAGDRSWASTPSLVSVGEGSMTSSPDTTSVPSNPDLAAASDTGSRSDSGPSSQRNSASSSSAGSNRANTGSPVSDGADQPGAVTTVAQSAAETEVKAAGNLPDDKPIDGVGEGTALGGVIAVLALTGATAGGNKKKEAPQSAGIESPTTNFRGMDADEAGIGSTTEHTADSDFDRLSKHGPERLAMISPLLGRIGADGGYLRAVIRQLWFGLPLVGLGAGLWAGSQAQGLVPPAAVLAALACVAIIDSAIGVFAFVGLLVIAGPGDVGSWADVRLLFGLASICVVPALVASGLRPLRRPLAATSQAWASFITDLVALPLFTSFVVTNMVAELPVLGGLSAAEVSAAGRARWIGAICGMAILARMAIERIVAATRANRLLEVEPPELPDPHRLHPIFALPLRACLFLLVATGFLPWCWELFVGTACFLVGPIIGRPVIVRRLPSWPRLRRFLPTGLVGFGVMFYVGGKFGGWLGGQIDDPFTMLRTGFVVLALPGLLITVLKACSMPRPEPEPEAAEAS